MILIVCNGRAEHDLQRHQNFPVIVRTELHSSAFSNRRGTQTKPDQCPKALFSKESFHNKGVVL